MPAVNKYPPPVSDDPCLRRRYLWHACAVYDGGAWDKITSPLLEKTCVRSPRVGVQTVLLYNVVLLTVAQEGDCPFAGHKLPGSRQGSADDVTDLQRELGDTSSVVDLVA